MKHIEWSEEKNLQLKKERDLSFEATVVAIENGKLVDIVPNPGSRYPHQKTMIIEMDNYLVLVPFVEDQEKIFLKTAFKSRKITKSIKKIPRRIRK